MNSSFDDLVEAGIADASPQPTRSKHAKGRREGYQPNIPGRHPGPPGETKVGVGDDTTEEDPGSEISEPEVSSQSARVSLNPSAGRTPPSSNARKNGRANGKRVGVGVRISPRSDDDDDDEDEIEQQLKPLAKRRKGSVAPIRIVNSNFNQSSPTGNGGMEFDSEKGSSSSPTPSATSIPSLIREKLGQVPIPGMFRNKKPKEYKLQAFVSILFLTIIVLVGSIYIIHKEKELQVRIPYTTMTTLWNSEPAAILNSFTKATIELSPISTCLFPSFSLISSGFRMLHFHKNGNGEGGKELCTNINVNYKKEG